MPCVWEAKYPLVAFTPASDARFPRKTNQGPTSAPNNESRLFALKSAEGTARDFRGGLKPQPSYTNNVVGSSSRRKFKQSKGHKAARLRVAVDVDEGIAFQGKASQARHKLACPVVLNHS